MPFYPCRGGGVVKLSNAEQKIFNSNTSGKILTTITLDKNYSFAYIVTSNNAKGDDNYVYVELNNVKQHGTYIDGGSANASSKSFMLNDLKKGDVLTVRGLGFGLFYK